VRPRVEATAQFDPEIASIFTEEATELLESVGKRRSQSLARPTRTAPSCARLLKRPLHTLKGGARMAGIAASWAI
jgi:chemotaxis protein histidine kinase CheA